MPLGNDQTVPIADRKCIGDEKRVHVLGNNSLVRRRIGYFAEWALLVARAHLAGFGSRDMPSCLPTTGKFQHFGFLAFLHMRQARIIAKITWRQLPPSSWHSPNPFLSSRRRRL